MEIIKNKSKLNSYATDAINAYVTSGMAMHVAIVSAIYHAASTGYVETLTRLYNALRSNDQVAMRQYIDRVHVIIGMGGSISPEDVTDREVIKAARAAGQVITFAKGEFRIAEGRGHTTPEAKALAKMAADDLINPDGKLHKHVLERNNFQQSQVLGDADILKALLKSINTESTNKRSVHVSPKVVDFLAKIKGQAEGILEQTERQNEQSREVAA